VQASAFRHCTTVEQASKRVRKTVLSELIRPDKKWAGRRRNWIVDEIKAITPTDLFRNHQFLERLTA
jgi:hypothetical protein